MNKDTNYPYLRIGYSYKIILEKPLLSGDTITEIKDWRKETIKEDHPDDKNIFSKIPKYHGTVDFPSHTNYKREIKGYYNTYEPLTYKPIEGGNHNNIMNFLKHLFQEQLPLALDYLKVIYEHPVQALPVLCLVSEERKTGKTTFLDFLKLIYGKNMTINSTQDFQSRFNSDFKGKIIIAIEEVLFNKLEDTEKIKQLSTAKSFKSEAKGKDREETSFFSKIILVSNHEENFIKIDPTEDRFWVIKVNPFEDENVNLLSQMEKEIPSFLNFLLKKNFAYKNETRVWFKFDDYKTKALRKVIINSHNKFEYELINLMLLIMEQERIKKISFVPSDLSDWLSKSFPRLGIAKIRWLLKKKWMLKPEENSLTYNHYFFVNGTILSENKTGRYYTIDEKWIKDNFDELMN